MKALRFEIEIVNEAFKDILDENIRFDIKTRHRATCISNKVHKFKCLSAIIIWFDFLYNVNIVSKMLQNINVNFLVAMEHLGKLKSTILKFRSDEHFVTLFAEARKLAQCIVVEDSFPPDSNVRNRKRNDFLIMKVKERTLITQRKI